MILHLKVIDIICVLYAKKRFNEIKLDNEIACELATELLSRFDEKLSLDAKTVFKRIRDREAVIHELYEENKISRKALRIEKKLIGQERRLYIQQLASTTKKPIDWYSLSIAQKKRHIKKIIVEIEVKVNYPPLSIRSKWGLLENKANLIDIPVDQRSLLFIKLSTMSHRFIVFHS